MLRKRLSAQGMFSLIREQSLQIPDDRLQRPQTISIADATMSAVGMFELKSPSMLEFINSTDDPEVYHNIKTLFQVDSVPSDTTMREVLDPIETHYFQDFFKLLFSEAQRGKVLEDFVFLEGAYLLSIDGTGFFNSHKVNCKNCCVKNHKTGEKTYYHQMLSGVIVHPSQSSVIPLAPEPISNTDGATKNDCERNAAARFLRRFRREHPHLKVIVTEDGLSSNGPHIRLLQELEMQFILGCKPGDHQGLFHFVEQSEKLGTVNRLTIVQGKITHEFRWMNCVPINDANPDLLVNFLEYWEKKGTGEKEKTQHFSWVTGIEIKIDNVMEIMRGGRARWKIENETFNTLKNLGYQFEHNFGHGHQNLSNNLAVIMMLVFLIDQLQKLSCTLFQKALAKVKQPSRLWRKMRSYFSVLKFKNWEDFLLALVNGVDVFYKVNSS